MTLRIENALLWLEKWQKGHTGWFGVGNYIHNMATFFSGLAIGFINCWQIALITLATGPFIVAAGGISNIFLHRLAENIPDAYAKAASVAEQAISYIRTLYAFTNETLAKYSYATSLQATLRYGILISLVQGLGLGFTYGLAICSCALQLYVGRFLVQHNKAHGGEIVTALFAIILSGLGLNQAATNFYSFEQGRIVAYRLYEMISRSSSTVDHDGNTLDFVQGNIEFRNVYFSYLSRPEIPILTMLRNEVGWFDEEENSANTLTMRLSNDATFVRAAFSNRLSIFIQDFAAIIVAFLIGMLLQWRLALMALATLPILTLSAIAQV
ncbi:hypothetical protein CTI12_AA008610 [Artemisia annua]|uniref:ABC transmembrane type-1 domain-containing protein n=1 Tax=Artemisia annua TaxID=35608 RepID=A0A2U1QBX4_ARTAN|nr:hypothetical protein CTI12_AA008610 [Artemisia annua]